MRPRRHVQFPYPGIPQTFNQKLFRLLVEPGGEQGATPQGVLSGQLPKVFYHQHPVSPVVPLQIGVGAKASSVQARNNT
jgi:hypothetical protein